MTKPATDTPPTVGEDNPALAAVADKLAARGLTVVPASELETQPRVETGEEAKARNAVRLAHYQARWGARLPVMYAHAKLADLESTPVADTPEAARKTMTWLASESSPTLILAGDVGVGKTHAAYAIGNTAVARGIWTEAWTVTDLLEGLRPGGELVGDPAPRSCRLLVLDDLGAGKATDWAVDTLTALVDHRLKTGLRQIVTTNHPYDTLVEAWGARLMDRLAYRWTVATFTGPSRRRGW
jgi:DNA replication protein DnaC